jgi:hypothetical protein
MAAMKEWLLELQEQGDDGTGHCDYAPVLCGDCLRSDCYHLQERGRV